MASSANSYPVTSSNAVDELWILKRQTQDGCQPSEYCSSSPSSEQDQYYTWSQSPQTEMERQPTASSTVYSKSEPSMRHRCPKKQCGSNFARFSDLSRHLRTVHGPKQQCLEPGCFYHTARSDNMREHCRRKHSNPCKSLIASLPPSLMLSFAIPTYNV
ncbi:hypothetical protein F5884DRAFT_774770 [Xylogone sp. PMI_703]|nr:hypothetical protein F5884DRAFT_774770 [Xylogone sp. PMI_703]